MKALPSYVQAYSKHQASFIFRISELDIPAIASSWGLLKLPRMPELKTREVTWDDSEVNVHSSTISTDIVGNICLLRSTEGNCTTWRPNKKVRTESAGV